MYAREGRRCSYIPSWEVVGAAAAGEEVVMGLVATLVAVAAERVTGRRVSVVGAREGAVVSMAARARW